ncbi:outer membrane beta-barrel protein [Campylobacter geochelonis]|uniref:outer membrane beta-barrel protein n=2 Tax=Campylobacter geochelonis TaxID=1780362 RepID=UPI00155DC464|nr:outer membrane beta-barrel protein [Campylobacter geochelonis]QKF70531.1 hypothetical protein CGEO_0193 [Campylobacter geochelonis]
MKNLLVKSALVAIMLGSSAFAQSPFFGVYGGYSKSKLDADSVGSIDDKRASLGIKGGYDFDKFRVYGAYEYGLKGSISESGVLANGPYDSKLEWKRHNFLVGADLTPKVGNNFKFLAGVYAGYSLLDLKADLNFGANSYSETDRVGGFIYGAKVGGIYSVNANNELELGYRYDKANYDSISNGNIDVDESNHGPYIGYNYKF